MIQYDCKTVARIRAIDQDSETLPSTKEIIKCILCMMDDIRIWNFHYDEVTALYLLVDGLMDMGYPDLLSDVKQDPDCPMCEALRSRIRYDAERSRMLTT